MKVINNYIFTLSSPIQFYSFLSSKGHHHCHIVRLEKIRQCLHQNCLLTLDMKVRIHENVGKQFIIHIFMTLYKSKAGQKVLPITYHWHADSVASHLSDESLSPSKIDFGPKLLKPGELKQHN